MRANDPIRNFRFKVEIKGIEKAGFREVSGFDISIDVIEYREGTDTTTPRKLPGLTKYSNITLKTGVVDKVLYDWIFECVGGKIERKETITLNVYGEDDDSTVVASWTIANAWPVKYTAPDFNATGNDVAVESLEIAHEGLTRSK